jgi:hypothetical protein
MMITEPITKIASLRQIGTGCTHIQEAEAVARKAPVRGGDTWRQIKE